MVTSARSLPVPTYGNVSGEYCVPLKGGDLMLDVIVGKQCISQKKENAIVTFFLLAGCLLSVYWILA